jgi:23S rRNA (cytosine1962-C5)-methyltransferase
MSQHLQLICYEDEHLLVINKPPGISTHAPGPFAGEGIYDWLRHREPHWASLAIVHRLDKETSGVMVFGKTPLANRSLTHQFAHGEVRKLYRLVSDRKVGRSEIKAVSALVRVGEKYRCRPLHAGSDRAETRFRVVETRGNLITLEAEPVTGRTHQIRAQAADQGFPIMGDPLYGGTSAPRLFLHAESISFRHPASSELVTFSAPADFLADARLTLRSALIESDLTNAYRMIHGAGDGWPGWYVDRLGDFVLSQSERPLTAGQSELLNRLNDRVTPRTSWLTPRGTYHKLLTRRIRQVTPVEAAPQLVAGEAAPQRFRVLENGLNLELSFGEGYSVGLFLDQRDNRRRLLVHHVAADFPLFTDKASEHAVLNTFAYTCGFSLCAAKAGLRTTNVDLSAKYLEWGKRNFMLNGLDPSQHEFLGGDAFDWLRRLRAKQRMFDVIILDPPTFSQSKTRGVFRAEKHIGQLVAAALPLLKRQGVLFASTNAATLKPEQFLHAIEAAAATAHRAILQRHYVPQPPDFPILRTEPAHLKTVWLRLN